MGTSLELVAAVSWKVVICSVYEPLLHFVVTWHRYKKINGEMMHIKEILVLQHCQ